LSLSDPGAPVPSLDPPRSEPSSAAHAIPEAAARAEDSASPVAPYPTPEAPPSRPPPEEPPGWAGKLRRVVVGAPRDLADKGLFHRLSLIPFLAWVGLGADGLSSSSYGPDEAFRTLGPHTYLAVGLGLLTALTVLIIASAYSRIIEEFPHGGGGYVVATKVLGERLGVVSGCALLVDYVLTVAVSLASAADAIFSFLPEPWLKWKLATSGALIFMIAVLNIRGVRESVTALLPIFIVFLVTHVIALVGGLVGHASELPATARAVGQGFSHGLQTMGAGGLFLLFLHAYSLGGGTYTGIEAVSNGLPIMREPRVQTGKRTMIYMATSLSICASGLLLCYLLWQVVPLAGKTMNAALFERMTRGIPGGSAFVILSLLSEGALLVVAAQAGFIDGPRVLSNMATDSWMPRRFSALSERLTTQNGVVLMAISSLAVLLYERGDVRRLVVMYSINVFLTFSLSMLSMLRLTLRRRTQHASWKRRAALFGVGLAFCLTILVITTLEKFVEGGWLTVLVTAALVFTSFLIRRHYRRTGATLAKLYAELDRPVTAPKDPPGELRANQPTAAILVAAYGGLGIHTVLSVVRVFPGQFKNMIFVSVGVIDSGTFKGEGSIAALHARTEETLGKYVTLAHSLGFPATYRCAVGMDAVHEGEKLCLAIAEEFPGTTFFAGKIIFQREAWYQRLLHNETALAIQNRLFWAGKTMVILPARME
jgi:amino acid transporter